MSQSFRVSSGHAIATATEPIRQGNVDVSQRAEEQFASLQKTAASMEQLTVTVRENTNSAVFRTQIASTASAAAISGGEAVARVVQTMEGLITSPVHVAEIVNIIGALAPEINIL